MNAKPGVDKRRGARACQWRKGWTPWGTPCSVLVVDGMASVARAAEKHTCPLGRLADGPQAARKNRHHA